MNSDSPSPNPAKTMPFASQESFKVTEIFGDRGSFFVVYDQEELKGQVVRWHGELLYDGYYAFPACAWQIEPVTSEQIRCNYLVKNDIRVIREISKDEYPALKQAIDEFCTNNVELVNGKPFRITF